MDGSSMSVIKDTEDKFHVCSRNLSLDLGQEGNSFVDTANRLNLEYKMKNLHYIQVSGELCGEGIQKNKDNIKGRDLFVFDVYNIRTGQHEDPKTRWDIVSFLGLKHVPVLHEKVTLRELGLDTLQKIIDFADGSGYNCEVREEVVFKSWSMDFSFKAISNKFLEKYGE